MFSLQFTCHKCLLYSKPLQGVGYIYTACTYKFVKKKKDTMTIRIEIF